MNHHPNASTRRALAIAIASNTLLSIGSVQASSSFVGLGYLPGTQTYMAANRVSSDGRTVVGAGVSYTSSKAAYWTPESGVQQMQDLPGAGASYAVGVSGNGQVIVGRSTTLGGRTEATRTLLGQSIQSLYGPPPVNVNSYAYGSSADGSVVVGSEGRLTGSLAFRWTAATGPVFLGTTPGPGNVFQANSVSADGTVVVGHRGSSAFRWASGTGLVEMQDLPGGGILSEAWGISADGTTIVGNSQGASSQQFAVRWDNVGAVTSLGHMPGGDASSHAVGVSADGSLIVGFATFFAGAPNLGFVWDADHGMRSVSSFLAAHGINTAGWRLTDVSDVSADGLTLIGGGVNPSGQTQYWVATIPAPGDVSILCLGGLFMARRRHRSM